MKRLLNPQSIAVVGASREKDKLGRMVLDNIIKSGYKGDIIPINPKAKKVAKLTCFPSIKDVPKQIDLAVIAIPSKFVPSVIVDCCVKRVGAVAVISSGFSEVGEEGLKQELEMKKLAEDCGIKLLGPNCLGVISTKHHVNATFAKNDVIPGNVAFLSQSGALGTAALDWAERCNVGFSHFISLGNKAVLSENEFIEELADNEDVDVIALYLEDFSNGRRFMQLAAECQKPIVVLKPGKSEAAQEALGSHTGSLAQDDLIISAALKQSGVIRVETIEELFNTIKIFSWCKYMKGSDVAIVTNAGGPGVITTDALELKGLKLAVLKEKTEKYLSKKLPPAANIHNPIDVLGDALAQQYKDALQVVIKDKNVDAVVVLLTPQVMTEIKETAKVIIDISKTIEKPVIAVFLGGVEVQKGRDLFAKAHVPCFRFPNDAVVALNHFYQRIHKRLRGQVYEVKGDVMDVTKLLQDQQGVVDTQIAEKILEKYEIPLLKSVFPHDIADARRKAVRFKYPVVLKLIHEKLLHKTDKEAVKLDIKNEKDLDQAYGELQTLAEKEKLENYKIEMQHFVKGALELILGVKRDSDQVVKLDGAKITRKHGFGHSLLFGMGGIYTEVYKDIALRIIPLNHMDIGNLINDTKVSEILKGARGKTYDIQKVKDVIGKINQLIIDFPQIQELDINPLFAKDDDVWVVDVKMILEE